MARAARKAFALEFAVLIREDDPGLGGEKIFEMYKKEFKNGKPIGRDAFLSVLNENGMKIRQKLRRKPKTTDSTHGLPTYPNLIKEFIPTSPNQLWVSDITYILIKERDGSYSFCYLSLIMDAYTKEIVGWSVGPTLETAYPLEALRMALKRIEGKTKVNLIHHSDRGCQYASSQYISLLRSYGIRISMTESGDPLENSEAERLNNTMKNELLKGLTFTCVEDVEFRVLRAVEFYNNRRPHMSIDMMTPAEAAFCDGEIQKRWTSFREIAIKNKINDSNNPENSLPLSHCLVDSLQSQPSTGIRLG